MIHDLLALAIGLILIALTLTMSVNVLVFPRLRQSRSEALAQEAAHTAALIPARNEARAIGDTVRGLLAQQPPIGRVLVLDDGSTDGTAAVARAAADGDPRLTILHGSPLPTGWLGKNWACHQLSQAAGEGARTLLYTDADVLWRPGALAAVLAEHTRSGTDLTTVWPTQQTETWGERLVVPLMALAIFAYLPVLGVHHTRFASLAAANGQCLLFNREAYAAISGHAGVRADIVEDVAFARRIKLAGRRLRMADGAGLVVCRMYRSWSEVRDGFAKNILAGHGGTVQLAASTVFHLGVFVLPWLMAVVTGAPGWLSLSALGLGLRALSAAATGQRLRDAVFMPISALAMTVIAARALAWHVSGGPRWKGRGPESASHSPIATHR
jgi:chlorobactene glucosyltransferase